MRKTILSLLLAIFLMSSLVAAEEVIDVYLEADDGNFDGSVSLIDDEPSTYSGSNGDYELKVLDSVGNVLWGQNFELSYMYNETLADMPFDMLGYKIPYNTGMFELKLYKDGDNIFSKQLSFCNNDGVCDYDSETHYSCPSDCSLPVPTHNTDGAVTFDKTVPKSPLIYWIESVEHDNSYLWAAEPSQIPNPKVFKVDDDTGNVVGSYLQRHYTPGVSNVIGLAYDHVHNDIFNHVFPYGPIYVVDANPPYTEIRSFSAPANWIHDISFDGTYLWAVDGISPGYIYKISAATGSLIKRIYAPVAGGNPTGVTFDGQYLWITAGGFLFQIDQNRAVVDGHSENAILHKYSIPVGGRLGWDNTEKKLWTQDNNHFYRIKIPEIALDTGFRVLEDGYNFENHGVTPSWQVFKDTFPQSTMEYSDGTPKPNAYEFFSTIYSIFMNGRCDGMSSSSWAFFTGAKNVKDFNSTANYAHDLSETSNLNELINYFQGKQLTPGILLDRYNQWKEGKSNIADVYYTLKNDCTELDDPHTMTFIPTLGTSNFLRKSKSSHTVVPYEIKGEFNVYIYDSNNKDDISRSVTFNPSENAFIYAQNNYYRVGNDFTVVTTPLSSYLSTDWRYNVLPTKEEFFSLYGLRSPANMIITDQYGRRVGSVNDTVISEIPEAMPVPLATNGQEVGYELYAIPGDLVYSVNITGTGEGTYDLDMFEQDTLYQIIDATITEDTEDVVALGDSITYTTNDLQKNYSVSVSKEIDEYKTRVYTITDTELSSGESATVGLEDAGEAIAYVNEGNPKTYDLTLEQVGEGAGLTKILDISIGADTTHIFEATDWSELDTTLVTLSEDIGNDGTIDEVSFVQKNKEDIVVFVNQEIQELSEEISESDIASGIKNSLLKKLENSISRNNEALVFIEQGKEKQSNNMMNAAKNILTAFVNEVKAQKGKKIESEFADQLITKAIAVQERLQEGIDTPL